MERQSNLELLRIFSMFLIVMHHFSVHGGIPLVLENQSISPNLVLGQFFYCFGKVGVNLFVMITGYFLITRLGKLSSFLKLVITTFFYSVTLFLICSVFSGGGTFFEFIKALLPLTSNQYWFITAYCSLFLLSPLITQILTQLDRKIYAYILVFVAIFASFIPTFIGAILGKAIFLYYCSDLLWFMFIFSLAGFIRLYVKTEFIKNQYLVLALAVMLLGTVALIVISDLLMQAGVSFFGHWSVFFSLNSCATLIFSVLLFLLFVKTKIRSNNFINKWAMSVLGVYLLHDNSYVRPLLWIEWIRPFELYKHPYFALESVVILVMVFIGCSCIAYVVNVLLKEFFAIGKINNLFSKADLFWHDLFGNTSKSFVKASPKLKKREKSMSQ